MRRTPSALLVLLAVALAVLPATGAGAVADVTPARVAGAERVATAAQVADLAQDTADLAVLANADDTAGTLLGAALAGVNDGVLLLTRTDELPDVTDQLMTELGVRFVQVVGDEEDVSATQLAALEDRFEEVQRQTGPDPAATSAVVARQVAVDGNGLPAVAESTSVMIANPDRPADALAGSWVADLLGMPILYAGADGVPAVVQDALADLGAERAFLLGGEVALGADVEGDLAAAGIGTTRVAGATRVETALEVADAFSTQDQHVLIARGDVPVDALTAGQLGGALFAPILLTATPDVLPATATDWLTGHCDTIQVVRAVGGTTAVSEDVLDQAETAAEACAGP